MHGLRILEEKQTQEQEKTTALERQNVKTTRAMIAYDDGGSATVLFLIKKKKLHPVCHSFEECM